MYNLSTVIEQSGIEKGSFEALASLVKDGLLAIEEASKRVGLTVEEFQKKMNVV